MSICVSRSLVSVISLQSVNFLLVSVRSYLAYLITCCSTELVIATVLWCDAVECSSMTGPMTDIITGNPMVVKMIVSFNRFTSTLGEFFLIGCTQSGRSICLEPPKNNGQIMSNR